MSAKSSVRYSWNQIMKQNDEDQEYAEAERAGLRADEQPQPRTNRQSRHLKVEEYSVSGKWRRDEQRGASIRLKGAWLAQIFKPNTRVSVEVSDGTITIKKE